MASQSGNNPVEISQQVAKDNLNYLNSIQDTPAVRLDAEFYQADDIDSATEGLTGSGNLNYLVLQSQQTNDASTLNNPFAVLGDGHPGVGATGLGGGHPVDGMGGQAIGGGFADDDSLALFDDGLESGQGLNIAGGSDLPGMGTGMGVAGATALKARNFNENGDSYNDQTNITRVETNDDPDDPGNPDGPDDPNGPDNPDNPNNPDPPVNSDDYDLVVDVDTPILDVGLDVILDPIEAIIGDIDIDIEAIVDSLLPGEHGLLPDISTSVEAILGGTTLLGLDLDDVLSPLAPVTGNVTNILDGLIDGVSGILPETLVQPITNIINTVLDLDGILGGGGGDTDLLVNVGAVIPGFTLLDTGLDIPLDPVEMILGDIDITIDAHALVEDLGTHAFSLIEDLGELDLEGVVQNLIGDEGLLQNLEGVIPDLDLGIDIAGDLLPEITETISSGEVLGHLTEVVGDILAGAGESLPVGDLLDGDVLGSDLVNGLMDGLLGGGTPQPGNDTDLVVNTGVDLLDNIVPDLGLEVPLDSVESLLGDIDITVDVDAITEGIPHLDIGLDVAGDILPDISETISTADVTGALDDVLGGILGGGETQPDGDTDLTLGTEIEVLGIEIPDIDLDIPLDPVEALVGDIDIDIDAIALVDGVEEIITDISNGDIEGIVDSVQAGLGIDTHLDLLGDNDLSLDIGVTDTVGGILEGALGGGPLADGSLTEGLGDVVGGLLGVPSVPDVLPDPVGTITEGLGSVIDTTPVLGGLFGGSGHHGGGLFG